MSFFFFNDTATTEIYTLSLHDALPISESFIGQRIFLEPEMQDDVLEVIVNGQSAGVRLWAPYQMEITNLDRKSTRLNSSHANISYAVFCLKKKKNNTLTTLTIRQLTIR